MKASDGWLAGFQSRLGIKLHCPKGESGSADLELVETACTVVGQMINELGYQLEDIYDMGGTGLYCAKPSKTLANSKLRIPWSYCNPWGMKTSRVTYEFWLLQACSHSSH